MRDVVRPWVGRVATFFRLRARTWGIQVPLHLVAFLGLFVISLRLAESAYVEAGSEASRLWLQQVILELWRPEVAKHDFEALQARHRQVNFRLYDLEGRALDKTAGAPLPDHLTRIGVAEPDRFWLDSQGEGTWMAGLMRVSGEESCLPCHEPDQLLGLASIRIDFTDQLQRIRAELRRSLAFLLVVWTLLLGIISAIVQRSARRFAGRLQEDLDTPDGSASDSLAATSGLVLDPVAAEVDWSIRRFLSARREREAQIAARLEHSDQLASLGRLAAGLAHEIKNPLAGIQAALEILEEDLEEGKPNWELCTQMLQELERVNQTLQLLLSSARPSEPDLREVDLGELLEEIQRFLAPGLRRRQIELGLQTPTTSLAARLDAAKIRQVLINLVDNAAEAIEGGGRITMRATATRSAGGVVITVEDDGPGIPPEMQETIFEPFFTTKFRGTGLGLALARSFVEQHGGTLEVDSVEGTGTRFLLMLPAAPDPARPVVESDGA